MVHLLNRINLIINVLFNRLFILFLHGALVILLYTH